MLHGYAYGSFFNGAIHEGSLKFSKIEEEEKVFARLIIHGRKDTEWGFSLNILVLQWIQGVPAKVLNLCKKLVRRLCLLFEGIRLLCN